MPLRKFALRWGQTVPLFAPIGRINREITITLLFANSLIFHIINRIGINKILLITEGGKIFVRLDKFQCLLAVIKSQLLLHDL